MAVDSRLTYGSGSRRPQNWRRPRMSDAADVPGAALDAAGTLAAVTTPGARFGASPEVMAKLGRLGKASGWALMGLPIVLSAADRLGDTGNAVTDVSAAAGQGLGGLAGGMAAAAAMPFPHPLAKGAAFVAGSMLGGNVLGDVARWGADTFQGISNDPLDRELREGDKRFEAALRRIELQDAVMAKIAEREQQQRIEEAVLANQLQQGNDFQSAALQAAMGGVNPSTMAFLQGLS